MGFFYVSNPHLGFFGKSFNITIYVNSKLKDNPTNLCVFWFQLLIFNQQTFNYTLKQKPDLICITLNMNVRP